jgi:hypothetical protein
VFRYEDIGPVVEAAEVRKGDFFSMLDFCNVGSQFTRNFCQGTLSFASNFERYQTDASVGLKLERDAVAHHREFKYDSRRQMVILRIDTESLIASYNLPLQYSISLERMVDGNKQKMKKQQNK